MTDNPPIAPWYRQPWFWFLAIFPLAAIAWCLTMIVVATSTAGSMVTDDYSKQGRGINMEIARDQKADDLGLGAEFHFGERQVTLDLSDTEGTASYPYLILNLYHPTLEEQDRKVQLTPIAEGKYQATVNQDMAGRWYFDLRGPDNDWRLKGEARLPSGAPIQLGSGSQG